MKIHHLPLIYTPPPPRPNIFLNQILRKKSINLRDFNLNYLGQQISLGKPFN